MIQENVQKLTDAAVGKVNKMEESWLKYFILSMMAGVYVGFGIVLIFSIAEPLRAAGSPGVKALMGVSFGVALTLVIFAGSELFTGNNMVMVIGSLNKKVSWMQTIKLWILCYLGNLVGAALLGAAVVAAGLMKDNALLQGASLSKISAGFMPLFIRGILCNMLVCLAVWTSSAAKEEVARLILIFWTLFAFIGSAFEHSVANMSLLVMGIMANTDGSINWLGYAQNLIPVTLGNMVGGGLFIGAAYWYVVQSKKS